MRAFASASVLWDFKPPVRDQVDGFIHFHQDCICPVLIWPAFCFVDKMKGVMHDLSVFTCTLQSSFHDVTAPTCPDFFGKICCSCGMFFTAPKPNIAALISFAISETRSLMKIRKSVDENNSAQGNTALL